MREGVSGSKILVAQNLTKIYSGSAEPAVRNLTLEIGEHEIFGLLGPNGAGKTTVISMLTTLLKPTDGHIFIDDIDALRYPKDVKKLIGYVPQDLALYQNLSARENLRYLGNIQGFRGKVLENRVSECISLVGLEKNADRRVYTYSGGMKRRTNLAAGILNKPRVLFLDEPTVGIDPQSRNLILEKLAAMKDETTMIYTTHYIGEVEHLCSRVAIMDFGSIIAQGTPGELMAGAPGSKSLEDIFISLTGRQLRD